MCNLFASSHRKQRTKDADVTVTTDVLSQVWQVLNAH